MNIELIKERKFTAYSSMTEFAFSLMENYCVLDPQFPIGFVNSIYFDTPHLKSYQEKIEGDNLKKKIRIRWYSDSKTLSKDTVVAFLEIKYRIGAARHKYRLPFSIDREFIEHSPLEDFALTRLIFDHAKDVNDLIPLNILPSICISYERRRFLCPRIGSRVCLDSNIRADRINAELFPSTNPVFLDMVVCEFKDSGHVDLPWASQLYRSGFRLWSFSKYGECINQILLGGAPR